MLLFIFTLQLCKTLYGLQTISSYSGIVFMHLKRFIERMEYFIIYRSLGDNVKNRHLISDLLHISFC